FFQAEDGIRDRTVTGVQTCALPICTLISHQGLTYGGLVLSPETTLSQVIACFHAVLLYLRENQIVTLRYKRIPSYYSLAPTDDRSEERRVGKECRRRWAQEAEKKK